jgi:hypothetical protein
VNSGVQQEHCSSTVHVEFSFVFNLLFDNDAIVIRICTILCIVHIYIYITTTYKENNCLWIALKFYLDLPVQVVPITSIVRFRYVWVAAHYIVLHISCDRWTVTYGKSVFPPKLQFSQTVKLTAMIHLKYCWKWC